MTRLAAQTKYLQQYLPCGFDMLVMEGSPSDFPCSLGRLGAGCPGAGIAVAMWGLPPLLVHALSLGDSTFAQLLLLTSQDLRCHGSVAWHIQGHIFSSLDCMALCARDGEGVPGQHRQDSGWTRSPDHGVRDLHLSQMWLCVVSECPPDVVFLPRASVLCLTRNSPTVARLTTQSDHVVWVQSGKWYLQPLFLSGRKGEMGQAKIDLLSTHNLPYGLSHDPHSEARRQVLCPLKLFS